ncbi:MAG: Ureidoglycolate hydrolase [Clostridia bacterium]|jgi:ureidoglycolate lyase|nr:Ureidoglycolate hydrolase [Clostridia bacterium]
MKNLQVKKLTQDNFKEYGVILSTDYFEQNGGDSNFGWWENLAVFEGIDRVSVNILRAKTRELIVEKLEYHNDTEEAVIPLGGKDQIIVVAKKGVLIEDEIEAFYLEGTKGVVLNKGVRHFIPYPVEGDVDNLIIFKDQTGANDLILEELQDKYKLVKE